jgi:acetolactate synthase-1/3 small subunit
LEKTGHKEETQALFNELAPFGILEFVRSGRIAITKPMRTLTSIMDEMENQNKQN